MARRRRRPRLRRAGRRPRNARAFRRCVGADRLHGHARQGGRRGRRVRRRASRGDRNAGPDGASLYLHDGSAAVARGSASREPRDHPRRTGAPCAPNGADRAVPRAGGARCRGRSAESQTAIQPLVVGANAAAVALADALWARGFWVPAIRPPTVPQGTARLRITLSAAHTVADVDALGTALAELASTHASRR